MDSIQKLTELFKKFPGIGERQARRFVYYLLRTNKNYTHELASLIAEVKQSVRLCQNSYQFFPASDGNFSISPIERNINRDRTKLLLVEKDSDLETIERSGAYNGVYFVLGGALPILAEYPERLIRINELKSRIENGITNDSLSEIIFALSVTPQGEHTEEYIRQNTQTLTDGKIKISTLGRGLSTGLELEYSDSETLKSALEGRK
jgi:recombination protein RecR